jgi:hypothetical protein
MKAQEQNPIAKGNIVKYLDGNYRVTSVRAGKVNLGSVFGSSIYYKGIPIQNVVENAAAFYEAWEKSETYMCM